MALKQCPECRGPISDKALFCPHCGFPMQPFDITAKQVQNPVKKFIMFFILSNVLLLVITGIIGIVAVKYVSDELSQIQMGDNSILGDMKSLNGGDMEGLLQAILGGQAN